MFRSFRLALALLALAPGAAPARASETCYVLVFGSQRRPYDSDHTHSWATFVRACGGELETVTISWLPATLTIDVRRRCPEPGVNLDLYSTLDWAIADGQQVGMWGPYRIEPELFCKARRHANRLASGAVRYKAKDGGYDTAAVCNCIHALLALVDPPPRDKLVPPGYGEGSSGMVADRYRRFMIEPRQSHPWVADALGLGNYPIQARRKSLLPGTFPRFRYR